MAERLEIRTFGGLVIKQGGRLIEGGLAQKAKALLVYLASTGRVARAACWPICCGTGVPSSS
jgi:hypothetical protein